MFESDGTMIEVKYDNEELTVKYTCRNGYKQILENGGRESM